MVFLGILMILSWLLIVTGIVQ